MTNELLGMDKTTHGNLWWFQRYRLDTKQFSRLSFLLRYSFFLSLCFSVLSLSFSVSVSLSFHPSPLPYGWLFAILRGSFTDKSTNCYPFSRLESVSESILFINLYTCLIFVSPSRYKLQYNRNYIFFLISLTPENLEQSNFFK